jgi:hypothetical protein
MINHSIHNHFFIVIVFIEDVLFIFTLLEVIMYSYNLIIIHNTINNPTMTYSIA